MAINTLITAITIICITIVIFKQILIHFFNTSRLCGSHDQWGIIHHLSTVAYIINQVM